MKLGQLNSQRLLVLPWSSNVSIFDEFIGECDRVARPYLAQADDAASLEVPPAISPTPAYKPPNQYELKSTQNDHSRCIASSCNRQLKRPYNKRCRLCSDHMAAAELHLEGCVRRFCQKCGKIHPLEEFEGLKRSCRLALERHNIRQKALRSIKGIKGSPHSSDGSLGDAVGTSTSPCVETPGPIERHQSLQSVHTTTPMHPISAHLSVNSHFKQAVPSPFTALAALQGQTAASTKRTGPHLFI